MSFHQNLRLALTPSDELPHEIHLGKFLRSWENGKLLDKGILQDFRTLTEDELRKLNSRLQAASKDHVILLNLWCHVMGDVFLRDLATCFAELNGLQVLILDSTCHPLCNVAKMRCCTHDPCSCACCCCTKHIIIALPKMRFRQPHRSTRMRRIGKDSAPSLSATSLATFM